MCETKDSDAYLDLYKHFEAAASSVKGAMFKNLTWLFGIASALLAFVYSLAVKEPVANPQVSLNQVSILVLVSGIYICAYALVSIFESAQHIRNNWDLSSSCVSGVPALSNIMDNQEKYENGWLYGVKVCRRLFWVTVGYGFAFGYTFFLIVKCA